MPAQSSVTSVSVRVENGTFGAVVMTPAPRVSWTTEAAVRGWRQEAAQIEWIGNDARETTTLVGASSVLVGWPFAPLAPRERGSLRVRVRGIAEEFGPWSEPVDVLGGHLVGEQWQAAWIAHPEPRADACPVLLTKHVELAGQVAHAYLYATAHGVYQIFVNGTPVDDEVLKPGWTVYGERDTFAMTEVTHLLSSGVNILEAAVAAGWYAERYGFHGGDRFVYGDQPELSAWVMIEYADGSTSLVATDGSWGATDDFAVRSAGIYDGQAIDARVTPGEPVQVAVAERRPTPQPRTSPPVRRMHEVPVRSVTTSASGATVVDFGQNLVGWLKIRVSGPVGTALTLRHAEVLEDGELAVRTLRRAKAIDTFILAGDGVEEFEPSMTFHGFRYAEISGWPGDFDAASVTAVVVHSDMRRTGHFETSEPLINRLHENVVWSMRSNFLSIPTDCPQRDERLGWTGDIQVFTPTASFLFDSNAFLTSWLADLAVEQTEDGSVPFVVPDVLDSRETAAAAWGDAATVVPWTLYQRFGDAAVLEKQFASMRAWADHVWGRAGDRHLWEGDFQFGDWLDPDSPPDRPADAKADPDIVATAHVFLSASLVSKAAEVLGRIDEARRYAALADAVKEAWTAEYVTPAGRIMSDAPTAYAVAICFGLVTDPAMVRQMGDRLAELVRRGGYLISTGFVGTPLIQDALCRTGHAVESGRLLLQTECPSWLYPVTMGATTIWERWDSMLPDGAINPGEMTSFNHYALGAVADWLHRTVGGLSPTSPGYASVRIAPTPIAGIDSATTSFASPMGPYEVAWVAEAGRVTIRASIPANASAEVQLPGSAATLQVGSGDYEWTVDDPRIHAEGGVLGIDSPLSLIIDDPRAYRAMREITATVESPFAREFLAKLDWSERATLRTFAFFLSQELLDQIDEALVEATSSPL